LAKIGPNTEPPHLICLLGFMGAGKTSVGKALAGRLGWKFVDLDEAVEAFERATVAEVFSRSGQAHFRRSETQVLRDVLKNVGCEPAVLSIGGGAFTKSENRGLLEEAHAHTVFLNASLDELWRRVTVEGPALRPLLSDKQAFKMLYVNRLQQFGAAKLTLNTEGKSVDQVANELLETLHLNRTEA